MKRIGIISDSHRARPYIDKAVKMMGNVDMILHLGDNIQDAYYIESLVNVPVYKVLGNCDVGEKGLSDIVLNVDDHKILMTHGHKYNIKYSLMNIYYKALEVEANIVMFGHTHVPVSFYENGILFFNPGSTYSPRGDLGKSFGVLELDGECINIKHFEID